MVCATFGLFMLGCFVGGALTQCVLTRCYRQRLGRMQRRLDYQMWCTRVWYREATRPVSFAYTHRSR